MSIVKSALISAIEAMASCNPAKMGPAVQQCLEALKELESDWDEERIDVIGSNGNTGDQYLPE
jgi:hypothetical protein